MLLQKKKNLGVNRVGAGETRPPYPGKNNNSPPNRSFLRQLCNFNIINLVQ